MQELRSEQVGSALRRLAEELVVERRRLVSLERENRDLRAQVEALEATPRGEDGTSPPSVRRSRMRVAAERETVTADGSADGPAGVASTRAA